MIHKWSVDLNLRDTYSHIGHFGWAKGDRVASLRSMHSVGIFHKDYGKVVLIKDII